MTVPSPVLATARGALASLGLLTARGIDLPEELTLLLATLPALEWSGSQMGQGDGPMGSGPGPLFAACPHCGGLREGNGHFVASAVGHREGCEFKAILDELAALTPAPLETLTDADRAALDDLRSRGFAVIVWTPEELGRADQGLVEDRLVELGHDVIHCLSGHEAGDEEAE